MNTGKLLGLLKETKGCDDIRKECYHTIYSLETDVHELLSVIKDCLSYADAMAVLHKGEAIELRDKCRAVIEKVENNNA